MDFKELFYFDIETVSKYPTLEEFKEKDTRGSILFHRKRKRKSENFKDWKEDINDVYISKAGIMPEFGKIVCISYGYWKEKGFIISSIYGHDEKQLIIEAQEVFSKISNSGLALSGYYIKGFDIPWLNKKMMKYQVEIPQILKTFNTKPWERNIFDLAEVWRSSGTLENMSFDEMLYDLDIETPKDNISGGEVYRTYWLEDNIEEVKVYCEKDVKASIRAAKRICKFV